MTKIGFVTDRDHPDLTADDRLIAHALGGLGATVTPVVWSRSPGLWRRCDALVLRSCWDYHLRPAAFYDWIEEVTAAGMTLWNEADMVRWNLDKRYLQDLAERGVPTPATRYLTRGARVSLSDLLATAGWAAAVVKPAISASAWRTWTAAAAHAGTLQARFDAQVNASDTMVQEYLPSIRDHGELALIFVDGTFSHAARRRFHPDFRDAGVEPVQVPEAVRTSAERTLACLPTEHTPLYARVDGVVRDGGLLMTEVELIEPDLFVRTAPDAADRVAAGIYRRLKSP